MNVSPDEAAFFFRLMLRLQWFVNQQLGLFAGLDTVDDYLKLPKADKVTVRNSIYEHPDLLDRFVAENPAGLAPDELGIVAGWKNQRLGKFYILRFLKRHTVFMEASGGEQLYAVLGLNDAIEDIVYPLRPPLLVEAVLLPFLGRIVYDGFIAPVPLLLGPGISADLHEVYMRAKRAGNILTSLDPAAQAEKPRPARTPSQDWRPVLSEVAEKAEALKAPGQPLQGRAFGVVRASLRLAQAAADDQNDWDQLERLARRLETALNQFRTELYRAAD